MDMELPHVEISQEETERAVMNESILGITCGDVGGIGLECLLKAWTMASHPWRARLYAQPEHLLGVAETLNGAPRELALALAEEGAANDITLVTLDDDSLELDPDIPEMQVHLDESGALDLESSVNQFREDLKAAGLSRVEFFSTRVKLLNGS